MRNSKPTKTYEGNILGCACLYEVDVETTGYMGGDSGHGGHSTITFKPHAGGDYSFEVLHDRLNDGAVLKIKIGGDWELEELSELLIGAGNMLLSLANKASAEELKLSHPDFLEKTV